MESSPNALYDALLHGFNSSPFNRLLQFRLEEATADSCRARIDMRPELVGNTVHGILHGGVSSAVLDTVGGAMATIGAWRRMQGIDETERLKRLGNLGTLDMRVDYLKPGRGEWFIVSAGILRAGNKVMVTRMEMHNHAGDLIACATGTYLY